MGTNFYWINRQTDKPKDHIGKRSAAGLYCWDCQTTLCQYGSSQIHSGNSPWYNSCPICGKTKENETLENNTTGRELGFNKNTPQKKTGVKTCCSFTWTYMKHLEEINKYLGSAEKIIMDEYGTEFTAGDFIDVLDECPIQFTLPSEFC